MMYFADFREAVGMAARSVKRYTRMAILAALLLWGVSLMWAASKLRAMGWASLRKRVPQAVNAGVRIRTGHETDFWTKNSGSCGD